MNSNRKTATIVGILFIIGTAAGVISVVLTGSIVGAPDYLSKVAANPIYITAGAFFILIMGLSLAMVPVVMFPIFRKLNETLAIGYVVFRGALETMITIAQVICFLALVILSQKYIGAGAPAASYFQTLGALLMDGNTAFAAILEIVFPLGALMFYYLLYWARLIPRWISAWGFIAAILYLFGGIYDMFSASLVILFLPMLLQEMVMAVWLIVKGFNPSAIDESTKA